MTYHGKELRSSSIGATLLLVAPFLSGCGESGGGAPPPNVVLVLVDQLRHDSAAMWMPRTNALAKDGVVFDQMRSAAPWTYPSVISMFSGLYPQQHGANAESGKLLTVFSEDVPLVPRILRGTYTTSAFVTNPFLQKWNPLHECFDHYFVDEFIGSQGNTRGNPDLVFTDHMFADTVNATVKTHFDATERSRPEFTYVHYIDVHGPWDEAPFDTGGADHKTTADAAYEIATRYIDERIVELYDYFDARYDGDMVFLVTSDHGQELGDDLEVGGGPAYRQRKATVHDFNTRIPFYVLPSERIEQAGLVIDTPVSNVDIAPTILDWAGSIWPPDIPGRSLLPLMRGEKAGFEERPIYSLMDAFGRRNDAVVIDARKLMRHWDPVSGRIAARFLRDLVTDPREESYESSSFGEYGRYLVEAAGTNGYEFPAESGDPTEHDVNAMKAIGYFGGDADEDGE